MHHYYHYHYHYHYHHYHYHHYHYHYCIAGIGATFSFLHQHPEFGLSSYDSHKDGSGVAYVSTLRPQLMMRPGEGLWQFPAVRVKTAFCSLNRPFCPFLSCWMSRACLGKSSPFQKGSSGRLYVETQTREAFLSCRTPTWCRSCTRTASSTTS
jgi:hypothetical protein